MLHPIYYTLTALLFIGCSFCTIGQSAPQKPRWDRRTPYQLTVKYLSIDVQTWTDNQSGLTVTEFKRTGPDSIVLSQQEQIVGTFLAEGNKIYSSLYSK